MAKFWPGYFHRYPKTQLLSKVMEAFICGWLMEIIEPFSVETCNEKPHTGS